MVQHNEHAQDDSRPEAGCADASAGSSETPSRVGCGEEELPSGWARHVDTREGFTTCGRPYYHNAELKLTTWQHPCKQAETKERAADPTGPVKSVEAGGAPTTVCSVPRTDQIKGVKVLLSASATPVSAAQVRSSACKHAAVDSEFQILAQPAGGGGVEEEEEEGFSNHYKKDLKIGARAQAHFAREPGC